MVFHHLLVHVDARKYNERTWSIYSHCKFKIFTVCLFDALSSLLMVLVQSLGTMMMNKWWSHIIIGVIKSKVHCPIFYTRNNYLIGLSDKRAGHFYFSLLFLDRYICIYITACVVYFRAIDKCGGMTIEQAWLIKRRKPQKSREQKKIKK